MLCLHDAAIGIACCVLGNVDGVTGVAPCLHLEVVVFRDVPLGECRKGIHLALNPLRSRQLYCLFHRSKRHRCLIAEMLPKRFIHQRNKVARHVFYARPEDGVVGLFILDLILAHGTSHLPWLQYTPNALERQRKI